MAPGVSQTPDSEVRRYWDLASEDSCGGHLPAREGSIREPESLDRNSAEDQIHGGARTWHGGFNAAAGGPARPDHGPVRC